LVISVKGTIGAFRNLTNRMEEAIGDAANIHLQYPGLVYGFIHVLRANRDSPGAKRNDVAVDADGHVARSIERFHEIMQGMTGRRFLQDDVARYESGCLLLVDMDDPQAGRVFADFPPETSGSTPAFVA
jgi:hypothetical protein